MRIFALETNIARLKKQFLSAEEREICIVFHHPMQFVFACIKEVLMTIVLVAVGALLTWFGLDPALVIPGLVFAWFVLVFFSLLRDFIDWRYDFLLLTTDKVVIVDQSSIFRRKVTPMNLENFASVSAETQYLNLFPFGVLQMSLKEGTGAEMRLRYIPDAAGCASKISDAVTQFQRRKDLRRYGN